MTASDLELWDAMARSARAGARGWVFDNSELGPSRADMVALGAALERAVEWIRSAQQWEARVLLPCSRCGVFERSHGEHRTWMGVTGPMERLCVPCLEAEVRPDVFSDD